MYIEQYIKKILKSQESNNEIDFFMSDDDERIEIESLNRSDDQLFMENISAEFSPPETFIKRVIIKPVPVNPAEFQLYFSSTVAQNHIYDFFDPRLILKKQGSEAFHKVYQSIELIEEGSIWGGTLNCRDALPPAITSMTKSSGKTIYQHDLSMPSEMTTISFHYVSDGQWLCESNYRHHKGLLNTLPILPYGGGWTEKTGIQGFVSLYALPRMISEHDIKLDIVRSDTQFNKGYGRDSMLWGDAFQYVHPSSGSESQTEINLIHKIISGELVVDLSWFPYERPFSYKSFEYLTLQESPHLMDISFRRI